MTFTPTSALLSAAPPRVPLEWWERVLFAFQRWWAGHPGLIRVARRVVVVGSVALVPLVIGAVILLPRFGQALMPGLWMTTCLGVMTVLARTRTIAWRTISLVYGVGLMWAFVVAFATVGVARASGMDASWDGTSIALAAFVEEPGKLVPVLVLAVLAPGRVRRFAAVDWALVGFASGAAFTVAEDGVRRLARTPGILDWLFPDAGLHYGWNPWTSGMFEVAGRLPVAAGHQVWTSNTTMAVGLGMIWWRAGSGRRWRRPIAVGLPLWAFVGSVSDHAAYNASVALGSCPGGCSRPRPGWRCWPGSSGVTWRCGWWRTPPRSACHAVGRWRTDAKQPG